MKHEVIDIKLEGYELSEDAQLYTYVLDNTPQVDSNRKRPAVIICPGGGYSRTSDREAEPVAIQYLAAGFHAFVLRYHVAPVEYPVSLLELAASVKMVRENAKEWNVDPDCIVVSGFSAGGHLAGSLGVFWTEDFLCEKLNTTKEMIRPNGCVLCYPVITSGVHAHRESFLRLLGNQYDSLVDKMSLENQVNEDMPPVFLWHTYTDAAVPVENSLLLLNALRQNNISVEFHMYPVGAHGLALANEETRNSDGRGVVPECQGWIHLATDWVRRLGDISC